nr:ATP-binding protein [Marinibactrum halimedae]
MAVLQEQYSFSLTVEDDLPEINADPIQIQQVMINLLKNAYESCADESSVSVILKNTGKTLLDVSQANGNEVEAQGGVKVEVLDKGPGMTADVMKNALTPFYSTKALGSGIGLALCKEIIEAHDGRLQLENRPTGGLAVSFTL